MTSRAGQKSRAYDARDCAVARRAGFTLIEVLLALALIALLLTLSVVGLDGLRGRSVLDEGAMRFETVLRMARSDAASRSKRICVSFSESGAMELLIESDPLGAPGVYEPYRSCTWLHQLPGDLVRVRASVLREASLQSLMKAGGLGEANLAGEESMLEPITFYPDGSGDSARIELASTRQSDTRIAVVEVDGLTGRIRTMMVTDDEKEDVQPVATEGDPI